MYENTFDMLFISLYENFAIVILKENLFWRKTKGYILSK